MIDRRTFIGTLAGGCFASPFKALAQPAPRVARVGILGNENGGLWDGFRQGMSDLGYVDGRNVRFESRWSDGRPERLPALARELVQTEVNVIVASSTQAIRAAMDASRTVPIVMAISSHPEKIGLVESLARPGGNVTGLSNAAPELMGKRFQILKELVPKASRLGILWNPSSPIEQMVLPDNRAAAAAAGIELQPVDVRTPEDYATAFAALGAGRADALHANGNPLNFRHRQLIADLALKHRLPSSYEEKIFAESGGLFSYAPSFVDLFRRSASYVDRILKGAKPADLPVEQPATFELVLNLKTARALELTVPPSLLLRADARVE